jgi:hypothetical protein
MSQLNLDFFADISDFSSSNWGGLGWWGGGVGGGSINIWSFQTFLISLFS